MDIADLMVQHRFNNNDFLKNVDKLIKWEPINKILVDNDNRSFPEFNSLSLFKACLLSIWRGLSDRDLEAHIKDSISASFFCDIPLGNKVPDHSTISRFRNHLSKESIWDFLLNEINRQFEEKNLIVKTTVITDATITIQARKPSRPQGYKEAEDRHEEEREVADVVKEKAHQEWIKKNEPGVDSEATWVKKNGKSKFGYKSHTLTDEQGLVLAVETTPANVHDAKATEALLNKLDINKGTKLMADKGYVGKRIKNMLLKKGMIDRRMRKAFRGRPLSEKEKRANKLITKVRYVIERTFGGQKKWFRSEQARYQGLIKTHGQHVITSIAYNLKRLPMLYLKSELKKEVKVNYV
jgi:IS5 family transposase